LTESTQTIITTFLSVRDEFASELQRQAKKLAEVQDTQERWEEESQDRWGIRPHGTLQTVQHQAEEEGMVVQHSVTATALQVEEEMALLMIENGILGSLDFVSIGDRHEEVEVAHHQTFEWIFKGSEIMDKNWDNFVGWLQQQDGIYWINGKAGAGKSTLMKYIFNHPQTHEELRHWAGSSACATAGFFFWNSGSEEQRSQRGLLRTLLFEMLKSHREFIPSIFPSVWSRWSTKVRTAMTIGTVPSKASLLSHEQKTWTLSQLKSAFQSLLRNFQTKNIKVCIFIDGLDEYGGDCDEIVEYFLALSQEPGIKMCLSSRPLVVFEEAFADVPGLKLQNLTYQDISQYVEDKLGNHRHMARLALKNPDQARRLVSEIVTKANGVFLWVKLVVKSLLQGLRDQNRITDLQRRLRHLPADLEALYDHMLQKTDPFYLEQASQIFQIVLVAQKESTSHQITLLQLSWADEEDKSSAIGALFQPLTEQEKAERCKLMDSRLKSVCSGLLESYDSKYSYIAPDARVIFLHRTVSDFFKKQDIWDKITKQTQGTDFSPYLSLLRSCVLQLKTLNVNHSLPLDMSIIRNALGYAQKAEASLDFGFPELLDQLDATASYQWQKSGGRAIGGRAKTVGDDFRNLDDSQNSLRRLTTVNSYLLHGESDWDSDSSSDHDLNSDNYFDCHTSVILPGHRSIHELATQRSLPRYISEARYGGYGDRPDVLGSSPSIENIAIGQDDFRIIPAQDGRYQYWTNGIELPGIKPFKRTISFYDLARGLSLQHYVAHKDTTGLVVNHDVNHHILLHAVTCYSRRNSAGGSKVPDLAVITRALDAGADPNFSFHECTSWEEVLTGVLAHISSNDRDEFHDFGSTRNQQWEEDVRSWILIMKVFLEHHANPMAWSKHWMQPRCKLSAIVGRLPESLAVQASELKILIEDLMSKSRQRENIATEAQDPVIDIEEVQVGSVDAFNTNAHSFKSWPTASTIYSGMVSWFLPSKNNSGELR